jgi:hypothetical protein
MGEGNGIKFNLILVKSREGSFEGLTRECELPFFFMSLCESLMKGITYGINKGNYNNTININLCFSLL